MVPINKRDGLCKWHHAACLSKNMARREKMKRNFFRLVVLLVGLLFVGTYSAFAYVIDDSGGDCADIGDWDLLTMTCTLTQDVSGPIVIGSDGVTLDGAGATVSGENSGAGILLPEARTGVTIKNVNVENFWYGIQALKDSNNNTLTENTVSNNNYYGIFLYSSSDNTLAENTVSNNKYYGIFLLSSSDNILTGNTASDNAFGGIYLYSYSENNILKGNTVSNNKYYGIYLYYYSENNILKGNTVSNNNYYGIYLLSSSDNILAENTISNNPTGIYYYDSNFNQIYNNNFIDNTTQARDAESAPDSTNEFDQDPPIGGNYWSDYTGTDVDGDGFGDDPYEFDSGGKDNFPWTIQDGWMVKDEDGDELLDDVDLCPGTPSGEVVNDDGCSIAQLCPCADPWKNHGKYVSSVVKTAKSFMREGLISKKEKKRIISEAAKSDCGKTKHKKKKQKEKKHKDKKQKGHH